MESVVVVVVVVELEDEEEEASVRRRRSISAKPNTKLRSRAHGGLGHCRALGGHPKPLDPQVHKWRIGLGLGSRVAFFSEAKITTKCEFLGRAEGSSGRE